MSVKYTPVQWTNSKIFYDVVLAVMAGNHGPEIHKVVIVDIVASVALAIVVVLRGTSPKETP